MDLLSPNRLHWCIYAIDSSSSIWYSRQPSVLVSLDSMVSRQVSKKDQNFGYPNNSKSKTFFFKNFVIGNCHKAPILVLSLDSSFVHLTFVKCYKVSLETFHLLDYNQVWKTLSFTRVAATQKALSCCVSGGQKVSRVAKSPIDWNHWLNAAAASTVYKKAAPQSTTAGQLHTSIRIENWVSFAAVLHHVERKADQFQPYWMKAA